MKNLLLIGAFAALLFACPASWAAGGKGGSFGGRSGGSGHSRSSRSGGAGPASTWGKQNGKLFTFTSRGELAIQKQRSGRNGKSGSKRGKDDSDDSNSSADIVSGFGRPLPDNSNPIPTGFGRPLQAKRPSLLQLPSR